MRELKGGKKEARKKGRREGEREGGRKGERKGWTDSLFQHGISSVIWNWFPRKL